MANAVEGYTQALTNKYLSQLSAGRTKKPAGTNVVPSISFSVPASSPAVATNPQTSNPSGIHKIIDILSQPLYAMTQTGKEFAGDITAAFHQKSLGGVLGKIGAAAVDLPGYFGNFGTSNQKKTWSDVLRGDPTYLNSFNQRAGINKTVTEERGPLAFKPRTPSSGSMYADLNNGTGIASDPLWWLKMLGGLTADVAGDPSSYIGTGLVGGALRVGNTALRTTETGAKVADTIAAGAQAAKTAAKETKLGQDLSSIKTSLNAKMGTMLAKQLNDAAQVTGEAQAAKELKSVAEAKVLATVPSRTTYTDLGAERVGENFIAPGRPQVFGELPAAPLKERSVLQDTLPGEYVQKDMLLDTTTGGVIPKSSILTDSGKVNTHWKDIKVAGSVGPKYPEGSIARQLLDQAPSELFKPVEQATELFPPALKATAEPVAEVAMKSKAVRPVQIKQSEWLAQHGTEKAPDGVAYMQHETITHSLDAARQYLIRVKGITDIKPGMVDAVQKASKKILNDGYRTAQIATQKGIEAARQATVISPDLTTHINALAHAGDASAKRLVELNQLRVAKSPKFTKDLAKEYQGLLNTFRASQEAARVRLADLVKTAPAMVARRTGERAAAEAARAASTAARATEAARTATQSLRRVDSATANEFIRRAYQVLDPQDAYKLHIASKDLTTLKQTLAGIKKARNGGTARYLEVTVPIYNAGRKVTVAENATDAAVAKVTKDIANDALVQARQEADTAEEILSVTSVDPETIASIARGEHLSETTRTALVSMMRKQSWIRDTEDLTSLPFESATGTARSAQVISEGVGHNIAYNSRAAENLIGSLFDANKEQIAAIRSAVKDAALAKKSPFLKRIPYEQTKQIYEQVIRPQLREAEDFLSARGVRLVASDSVNGVPLYVNQLFDAITSIGSAGESVLYGRILDLFGWAAGQTAKGRHFAIKGAEGTIPLSSVLKLGGYLAKMAGTDDAIKLLSLSKDYQSLAKELSRVAGKIGEVVPKEGEFTNIARGTAEFANGVTKETVIGKGIKNSDNTWGRVAVSEKDQQRVIDDIYNVLTDPRVATELFEHINRNAADFSAVFASEVQSVAKDTAQSVMSAVRDMTGNVSNAERANALLHPEKVAQAITNDKTVAHFATDEAKDTISQIMPKEDIQFADTNLRVSNIGDVGKGNDLMQALYDSQTKSEAVENLSNFVKPEDLIDYNMQTFIGKQVDFLLNTFVARYKNATLHAAIQQFGSLSGVLSREYMKELTSADKLTRKLAEARGIDPLEYRSVATEIFNAIRQGKTEFLPKDAQTQSLLNSMKHLTDYIFDINNVRNTEEATSLLGTWFRNGYDVDLINEKLAQSRFGLPDTFRLKTTVTVNGKTQKLTMHQVAAQVNKWDIKDPIDFLARMERVTTELATESAISREAVRLGKVAGLFSTKYRPGFIKLGRDGVQHLGDSDLKILDAKGLVKYFPTEQGAFYIHKSMIPELKRMDKLLEMVRTRNPGFEHFMRQNLDPILAMWKAGMTIWRPGHHFRNIIGDTSMAFLHNGTKNPVYYARALKMVTFKQNALGRTLRGDYGVWDAAAAMQGIHRAAEGGAFNKELGDEIIRLGKPGGISDTVVANVNIGGKQVKLDAGTVYQALMDRGVLPDFKKYEDIIDISGQGETLNVKIAKATHFEGSVGQKALRWGHEKLANFSEGRDDFIRIGDALSMIENGFNKTGKNGWKSLEEMFDQVSARIRQAHPDGSDLTPFEKSFARRIIPFYSWNRKAFPIVLENMMTHPGRFMVYPKAMYNFAQSQGVDLTSLTDPFPNDQLFPDFVTDKMTGIGWRGKDGRYWSFDIGVANADVMNQMLANGGGDISSIGHGLAGMLNPFLKVPIELTTGTQLNSVPITDKSDYVDSNLPGLNAINSVLGYSPSSVVENLLTGNGLHMDQNRATAKGNRGGLTQSPEYLANWLTGSKVLDTSKPNYQTIARLQMVDRMKNGKPPLR